MRADLFDDPPDPPEDHWLSAPARRVRCMTFVETSLGVAVHASTGFVRGGFVHVRLHATCRIDVSRALTVLEIAGAMYHVAGSSAAFGKSGHAMMRGDTLNLTGPAARLPIFHEG